MLFNKYFDLIIRTVGRLVKEALKLEVRLGYRIRLNPTWLYCVILLQKPHNKFRIKGLHLTNALFLFYFFSRDRVCLCIPGHSRISAVDQASFELKGSACLCLPLKVCTTTAWLLSVYFSFLFFFFALFLLHFILNFPFTHIYNTHLSGSK